MRDFNHTVNILVKAYLNDTLEHANCTACAVGNIVSACCPDAKMDLYNGWPTVFVSDGDSQERRPSALFGEAKRQITSTGYSWIELAKIERAFEKKSPVDFDDPEECETAMFNGLMAVVDVLAEIHGIDLTAKEQAKLLFVKA